MVADFFQGVGSGLALLMGLLVLLLFALWFVMPFLVLQLVRSNRTLVEEVRELRQLVADNHGEAARPSSTKEEGPHDRGSGPS